MSFMTPQIREASAHTETPQEDDYHVSNGGRIVQAGRVVPWPDVNLSEAIAADMKEQEFFPNIWVDGELMVINVDTGEQIENPKFEGYAWRLSASGYMDCTDWSHADTIAECIADALGTHGDAFDLEDLKELASYIDGFDDFLDGYLLALAFTGKRETEDGSGSNPDELFSNPGGDISEVCDPDSDVWEKISEDEQLTVMHDCLGFLCDALAYFDDATDYEQAGHDFHLTRNGHGAGFWDGDWPEHGDKLTELSEPYGSRELVAYGDSETFDFIH